MGPRYSTQYDPPLPMDEAVVPSTTSVYSTTMGAQFPPWIRALSSPPAASPSPPENIFQHGDSDMILTASTYPPCSICELTEEADVVQANDESIFWGVQVVEQATRNTKQRRGRARNMTGHIWQPISSERRACYVPVNGRGRVRTLKSRQKMQKPTSW